MATSKTLKPTNETISIPAMTDRPNQSVNSNCIDKLADNVNKLYDRVYSKLLDSGSAAAHTVTIPNSFRGMLIGTTSSINRCFAVLVVTYASGAVFVQEISKGSEVTFDTNTNGKLVISTTSSGTLELMVFAKSMSDVDGVTLV